MFCDHSTGEEEEEEDEEEEEEEDDDDEEDGGGPQGSKLALSAIPGPLDIFLHPSHGGPRTASCWHPGAAFHDASPGKSQHKRGGP